MKISIKIQTFFEYLVAVLLVLNGQSMWSKLEITQGWFSWMTLVLLWVSVIGIMFCSNRFFITKRTIVLICLIAIYLFIYICIRPINLNGILQLVLSVIALGVVTFETNDVAEILQCYLKIMLVIAAISLFFWIFGSMLSYIQPSGEVYSIWTGNGNRILVKNYYYLYFQQQISNIRQIDAIRNMAFFCEAPMSSLHFSFAFLIELFCQKRPSKKRILLLVIATLSTISITGYLVLICGLSAKYLLVHPKQEILQTMKAISVPIAIGISICVALYMYELKANTGSGLARLNDFVVGYQVWKKHLLFGVGYGNYDEVKRMMPFWRSSNVGFSNSVMLILDYGGLYFGTVYLWSIVKGVIKSIRLKNYCNLCFTLIFMGTFIITNIPFIYLTLFVVLSLIDGTMRFSVDFEKTE